MDELEDLIRRTNEELAETRVRQSPAGGRFSRSSLAARLLKGSQWIERDVEGKRSGEGEVAVAASHGLEPGGQGREGGAEPPDRGPGGGADPEEGGGDTGAREGLTPPPARAEGGESGSTTGPPSPSALSCRRDGTPAPSRASSRAGTPKAIPPSHVGTPKATSPSHAGTPKATSPSLPCGRRPSRSLPGAAARRARLDSLEAELTELGREDLPSPGGGRTGGSRTPRSLAARLSQTQPRSAPRPPPHSSPASSPAPPSPTPAALGAAAPASPPSEAVAEPRDPPSRPLSAPVIRSPGDLSRLIAKRRAALRAASQEGEDEGSWPRTAPPRGPPSPEFRRLVDDYESHVAHWRASSEKDPERRDAWRASGEGFEGGAGPPGGGRASGSADGATGAGCEAPSLARLGGDSLDGASALPRWLGAAFDREARGSRAAKALGLGARFSPMVSDSVAATGDAGGGGAYGAPLGRSEGPSGAIEALPDLPGAGLAAEHGRPSSQGSSPEVASVEGSGDEAASVEGSGDDATSVEGSGDDAASVEGSGDDAASVEGSGDVAALSDGSGNEVAPVENSASQAASSDGSGDEAASSDGSGERLTPLEGSDDEAASSPPATAQSGAGSSVEICGGEQREATAPSPDADLESEPEPFIASLDAPAAEPSGETVNSSDSESEGSQGDLPTGQSPEDTQLGEPEPFYSTIEATAFLSEGSPTKIMPGAVPEVYAGGARARIADAPRGDEGAVRDGPPESPPGGGLPRAEDATGGTPPASPSWVVGKGRAPPSAPSGPRSGGAPPPTPVVATPPVELGGARDESSGDEVGGSPGAVLVGLPTPAPLTPLPAAPTPEEGPSGVAVVEDGHAGGGGAAAAARPPVTSAVGMRGRGRSHERAAAEDGGWVRLGPASSAASVGNGEADEVSGAEPARPAARSSAPTIVASATSLDPGSGSEGDAESDGGSPAEAPEPEPGAARPLASGDADAGPGRDETPVPEAERAADGGAARADASWGPPFRVLEKAAPLEPSSSGELGTVTASSEGDSSANGGVGVETASTGPPGTRAGALALASDAPVSAPPPPAAPRPALPAAGASTTAAAPRSPAVAASRARRRASLAPASACPIPSDADLPDAARRVARASADAPAARSTPPLRPTPRPETSVGALLDGSARAPGPRDPACPPEARAPPAELRRSPAAARGSGREPRGQEAAPAPTSPSVAARREARDGAREPSAGRPRAGAPFDAERAGVGALLVDGGAAAAGAGAGTTRGRGHGPDRLPPRAPSPARAPPSAPEPGMPAPPPPLQASARAAPDRSSRFGAPLLHREAGERPTGAAGAPFALDEPAPPRAAGPGRSFESAAPALSPSPPPRERGAAVPEAARRGAARGSHGACGVAAAGEPSPERATARSSTAEDRGVSAASGPDGASRAPGLGPAWGDEGGGPRGRGGPAGATGAAGAAARAGAGSASPRPPRSASALEVHGSRDPAPAGRPPARTSSAPTKVLSIAPFAVEEAGAVVARAAGAPTPRSRSGSGGGAVGAVSSPSRGGGRPLGAAAPLRAAPAAFGAASERAAAAPVHKQHGGADAMWNLIGGPRATTSPGAPPAPPPEPAATAAVARGRERAGPLGGEPGPAAVAAPSLGPLDTLLQRVDKLLAGVQAAREER